MHWTSDESRSASRFAVERDDRPDLRDLIDDDTCPACGLIHTDDCEGDLP